MQRKERQKAAATSTIGVEMSSGGRQPASQNNTIETRIFRADCIRRIVRIIELIGLIVVVVGMNHF